MKNRSGQASIMMGMMMVTFMLLFAFVVNTGMLSQILKDLEVVPVQRQFGTLPLYAIFAALLTLVEAATGLLFAYFILRVRPDAPATRLAPLFAVFLVLGMAFVQGDELLGQRG